MNPDPKLPFDPYHAWLAIPTGDRPPTLYQLLGLAQGESNLDLIAYAADQRMAHVKAFANGPYASESQKLLNEISQARVILTNPAQRASYDQELANLAAGILPTNEIPEDEDAPIAYPRLPVQPPPPAAKKTGATQKDPTQKPPKKPKPRSASRRPPQRTPQKNASAQIAEQVANNIAELGPSTEEQLFPTPTPTRPLTFKPDGPGFDIGAVHSRVHGYRRKSFDYGKIIGIVVAATLTTGLVLMTIKGCQQPDRRQNASGSNTPRPTPTDPSNANNDSDSAQTTRPAAPAADPKPSTQGGADTNDVATGPAATRSVPTVPKPAPPVAKPPADPEEAVASAIGGIAPPKPRGKPSLPRNPRKNDSPTQVANQADNADPTPDPIPLPEHFESTLGKSLRALVSYDYETFDVHRATARKAANGSQDADAIATVDRLEQMELAIAKVWQLVHIATDALVPPTEIEAPGGAMAAVVEATPDRLVLRAAGQQRRYVPEACGPMKVYPTMTPKLVTLFADRVHPKSPQARTAIAFLNGLAARELPADDVRLWQVANEVWTADGKVPADFFTAAEEAGGRDDTKGAAGNETRTTAPERPAPERPALGQPNEGPEYRVARFRFDQVAPMRSDIKIPSDGGNSDGTDEKRLEVTRVYLGPRLGNRTLPQTQRKLTSGTVVSAEGPFVKLGLQLQTTKEGFQLVTTGMYRVDNRGSFRFEPIVLGKIEKQIENIASALKKKGFDVEAEPPPTLHGGDALDAARVPADADLAATVLEIGVVPNTANRQMAAYLRLRQIREFALELQSKGWVELRLTND